MKLSVIIVNYNVEYFLEQCILSVLKSKEDFEYEILMVDNASVDGSVKMVQEKFPEVKVIANKDNVGFSKANNQAIRMSEAEYVLLLNPDTVIEEDTLEKCVDFMDQNSQVGGLGVKMVDGKGIYLPESKRGLPDPKTSFFKLTGLTKLFPKSKTINKYYLGNLERDEANEIEVLSGAFMFMRNSVLDEIGLLDEDFFMYGEDIDLSYRITQAGYKNYYYPETCIIHYKGESTKKGSLNYVFVFYNAMVIFAKKHFSSENAKLYSRIINLAIWLRAGWTVLVRVIKKLILPFSDGLVFLGGLLWSTEVYGNLKDISYDKQLISKAFLAISIIYVLSVYLNRGYRKPWKLLNWFRAGVLGFVVSLGLYSLLPDTLRFSRALILFSPVLVVVYLLASRFVLNLISKRRFPFARDRKLKFGIIGNSSEFERVKELISQTRVTDSSFEHFDSDNEKEKISQIDELIKVYGLNEVVFCAANLSSSEIIKLMSYSKLKNVDFKIAPPESLYIIGSNSIDKKGDLFILDANSISKPDNQKKKRAFDLLFGLLLLILSPVLIWFSKVSLHYFSNLFRVVSGKYTFVGYGGTPSEFENLPKLKHSLISNAGSVPSSELIKKMNVLYARDYKWRTDLFLLMRNVISIGLKNH